MGNVLSDVCSRTETHEVNKNLIHEFLQVGLTYKRRDSNCQRPSSCKVKKCISQEYSDWISSQSVSGTPQCHNEYMSISAAGHLKNTSSDSELWKVEDEDGGEEGTVENSTSHFSTSNSKVGRKDCIETVGCRVSLHDIIQADISETTTDTISDKKSVDEAPAVERTRSKAIVLKTVDPPEGRFQSDKEYYVQNDMGEWETVYIERWNPWNGTWQVRGANGKDFPAAPIALKNKEEYEFLSRKRIFSPRRFDSSSEDSSTLSVKASFLSRHMGNLQSLLYIQIKVN